MRHPPKYGGFPPYPKRHGERRGHSIREGERRELELGRGRGVAGGRPQAVFILTERIYNPIHTHLCNVKITWSPTNRRLRA